MSNKASSTGATAAARASARSRAAQVGPIPSATDRGDSNQPWHRRQCATSFTVGRSSAISAISISSGPDTYTREDDTPHRHRPGVHHHGDGRRLLRQPDLLRCGVGAQAPPARLCIAGQWPSSPGSRVSASRRCDADVYAALGRWRKGLSRCRSNHDSLFCCHRRTTQSSRPWSWGHRHAALTGHRGDAAAAAQVDRVDALGDDALGVAGQ